MFCKSTRYKCVFKHVRRGIFAIVLGMRSTWVAKDGFVVHGIVVDE